MLGGNIGREKYFSKMHFLCKFEIERLLNKNYNQFFNERNKN